MQRVPSKSVKAIVPPKPSWRVPSRPPLQSSQGPSRCLSHRISIPIAPSSWSTHLHQKISYRSTPFSPLAHRMTVEHPSWSLARSFGRTSNQSRDDAASKKDKTPSGEGTHGKFVFHMKELSAVVDDRQLFQAVSLGIFRGYAVMVRHSSEEPRLESLESTVLGNRL